MDLAESTFLHSGAYTSFTVFADYPCHVRYVESVAVPLAEDAVDIYAIDPAPFSRWVVVQRRQGERRRLMFYVRTGNAFPEKPPERIPGRLRREISLRILSLKETSRGDLIQPSSAFIDPVLCSIPAVPRIETRFQPPAALATRKTGKLL